ncbi:MAG: acyltransferase [Muribaculaceae bacterium]|nr:acyltransferase [Muribaculaceae bacterium]
MTNNSKRSSTLDIIRGLSAILIVLFHYTFAYNERPSSTGLYETDWGWSVWWGYAAVTTFFMMSGFLAGPSLENGKTTPGRFIKKKALRFYPVYWVAMTVTTIVLACFYREEAISLTQYAANLTMVSQLFRVPFVDGVYWSMQCELVFCLICAGLMLIKRPRNLSRVLFIWVILAIGLSFTVDMKATRLFRIITICSYCHDFIAGIVLQRASRNSRLSQGEAWLLILCLLNSVVWHGFLTPSTIFFVITTALLFFLRKIDSVIPSSNRGIAVIIWVASISYPLYLVHEMVGFTIIRHLLSNGITHPVSILIPIAAALVLAWMIHAVVEKKLLKRFFKKNH